MSKVVPDHPTDEDETSSQSKSPRELVGSGSWTVRTSLPMPLVEAQAQQSSSHSPSEDPANNVTGNNSLNRQIDLLQEHLDRKEISQDQFNQSAAAASTAAVSGDASSFDRLKSRLFEGARPWFVKSFMLQEERRQTTEVMRSAGTEDMYEALRFLRGHKSVERAAEMLQKAKKWHSETMDPLLNNPAPIVDILSTGTLHLLPFPSKHGNPVMTLKLDRTLGTDTDRTLRTLAILFVLEKAISCSEDPLVEVDIIVDRTDVAVTNMRTNEFRRRIQIVQEYWAKYYPGRIGNVLIYPAPLSLGSVSMAFLEASRKRRIMNQGRVMTPTAAALQAHMGGADHTPQSFGGTMPLEFSLADVLLPKLKLQHYVGSALKLRFSDQQIEKRFAKWTHEAFGAQRYRAIHMTVFIIVVAVIAVGVARGNIVGCLERDVDRRRFSMGNSVIAVTWVVFMRWSIKRLTGESRHQANTKFVMPFFAMFATLWSGLLPLLRAEGVPRNSLCVGHSRSSLDMTIGAPRAQEIRSLVLLTEQVMEMFLFNLLMFLLHSVNVPVGLFVKTAIFACFVWSLPSLAHTRMGDDPMWVFQIIEVLIACMWCVVRLRDTQESLARFKEQEERAAALVATQEELSGLRNQTRNTPLFALDSNLVVTVWNSTIQQITGWRSDEVVGRSLLDKIVPEGSRAKVKQKIALASSSSSKSTAFEIPMLLRRSVDDAFHATDDTRSGGAAADSDALPNTQRKARRGVTAPTDSNVAGAYDGGHDSDTVVLLCNAAARIDSTGATHGLVLLAQDITERVRLEQARKTFVASFSHELRTPLTGIMGMLDLIDTQQISVAARRFVSKARVSSNLLLHLINDILDMSRIEAGNMELGLRPFNVHRAVDVALDLVRHQATTKALKLIVTFDDDVPESVCGDVLRFRQVLLNLLSNAVKFTVKGIVSVHISVDFAMEQSTKLRVAVKDTGIGIARHQQGALFNIFSKVGTDSDTVSNASGCGLGLAISARLVHLMGGEIAVQSELGAGSTFTFSCLCSIPDQDDPGQKDIPSDGPSAGELSDSMDTALVGKRVLFAEDNAFNAEVLLSYMEDAKIDATWTSNGKLTLESFFEANREGLPFDIVLMDCQMPVMDGWEATRALRKWEDAEKRARVPVIALTAYAMEEDKKQCLAAGMDLVVTKPVSRNTLLKVIATITEKKRSKSSSQGNSSSQPASGSNGTKSDSSSQVAEAESVQFHADEVAASQAMTASLNAQINANEPGFVTLSPQSSSRRLQAAASGQSTSSSANVNSTPSSDIRGLGTQMSSTESLPPHYARHNHRLFGGSSLQPIDEDLGLSQFGSRQMYYRMMSKFATEYLPKGISAIKAANKSGDIIALRMEAHSLKGSASFVGAVALSDVCGRLMTACGIEGEMSQWQQKFIDAACQQVTAEFDMLHAYFESKHAYTVTDGRLQANATRADVSDTLSISSSEAAPLPRLENCIGKNVLLGEDDIFTVEVLQCLVESTGMHATVCNDGVAVVEAYTSNPTAFDVIVLDCLMPTQGGADSTRHIRKWEQAHGLEKQVPILGLSAYKQHESECMAAGMNMFVVKPIGQRNLVRLIADMLEDADVGGASDEYDVKTAVPESGASNASAQTVDAARGRVEFGTDAKFHSFISAFARSEMADKLAHIRVAAACNDWKALHLNAHALKGSSGTACASDIHNTCKQLQHSCSKEGELVEPTSANEVQRLVAVLEQQCEALHTFCSNATAPVEQMRQQSATKVDQVRKVYNATAPSTSDKMVQVSVLEWLRDTAKVGDAAEDYALAMANEGFDTPGSWADLPPELDYLTQLGMKRGHAARILRLVASCQEQGKPSLAGTASASVSTL
eukprot:g937.t1